MNGRHFLVEEFLQSGTQAKSTVYEESTLEFILVKNSNLECVLILLRFNYKKVNFSFKFYTVD